MVMKLKTQVMNILERVSVEDDIFKSVSNSP